jgi:hypothetical protein
MTVWKVDKAVRNLTSESPELVEPASTAPNHADEGTGEKSSTALLVRPNLRGVVTFL